MLKSIKNITIASILITSALSSNTLEEMNEIISYAGELYGEHSKVYRMLLCEKEASYIFSNPQICLNATMLNMEEYNNMPVKGYDSYAKYLGAMYFNTGIIYRKKNDKKNEIKMYEESLSWFSNQKGSNLNLGIEYFTGENIKMNKYKAYEHLSIAAKQGDEGAQMVLDMLCSESPWACK